MYDEDTDPSFTTERTNQKIPTTSTTAKGEELSLSKLSDWIFGEGIAYTTPALRVWTGAEIQVSLLRVQDQMDIEYLQSREKQTRGWEGLLRGYICWRGCDGWEEEHHDDAD